MRPVAFAVGAAALRLAAASSLTLLTFAIAGAELSASQFAELARLLNIAYFSATIASLGLFSSICINGGGRPEFVVSAIYRSVPRFSLGLLVVVCSYLVSVYLGFCAHSVSGLALVVLFHMGTMLSAVSLAMRYDYFYQVGEAVQPITSFILVMSLAVHSEYDMIQILTAGYAIRAALFAFVVGRTVSTIEPADHLGGINQLANVSYLGGLAQQANLRGSFLLFAGLPGDYGNIMASAWAFCERAMLPISAANVMSLTRLSSFSFLQRAHFVMVLLAPILVVLICLTFWFISRLDFIAVKFFTLHQAGAAIPVLTVWYFFWSLRVVTETVLLARNLYVFHYAVSTLGLAALCLLGYWSASDAISLANTVAGCIAICALQAACFVYRWALVAFGNRAK